MSAKHNITIEQGADFALVFTFYPEGTATDPFDWSGWTGASQLRERPSGDLLLDLTVTADSEGKVYLSATADETRELTAIRGSYDVEMTSGSGYVIRILEGKATVTPEVTQ